MFYIKKIKINNFRCFKSKEFDFSPFVNIIIGPNGCGKTTIVEAVSYLCLGKSFKGAKDRDVVALNEEYFNVISEFEEKQTNKVVVSYSQNQKRIKKDAKVFNTLSEYVGEYVVVDFCPDDLYIIKGSPAERRRFIDLFVSQLDKKYLLTLSEFKKILKLRNEYLKNTEENKIDNNYLDVTTEQLIEKAKIIISYRTKYVNQINTLLKVISKELTNDQETVEINYEPNIASDLIEKIMISNRKKDIICQNTSNGPQKDDFIIKINGKEANLYGSQGQIRTAVLALKIACFKIFKQYKEKVVIILDDVFSELDLNRQKYLLNYIKDSAQTFITTTDVKKIPEEVLNFSKIIEIKESE